MHATLLPCWSSASVRRRWQPCSLPRRFRTETRLLPCSCRNFSRSSPSSEPMCSCRNALLPRYGVYFVVAVGSAYLISFSDPFNVSVSELAPALYAIGAAVLWGLGTVLW